MSTHCEKEFNLKNFLFHHKRPILFVTSQIGPQALYPVWTVIQVIYHIIALAVDGYQASKGKEEPSLSYFYYIHNWAYLLLVVSSCVDCCVTLYVHGLAKYILEERENKKAEAEIVMRNKAVKISYKTMGKYYTMRWYMQLTWAFFTISTVTGLTVTFLYWLLHFVSLGLKLGYSLNGSRIAETTVQFGTLAFNFFNTVVILLNLMITAKPFRLLHFYMPVVFFLVYIIFSVIYQTVKKKCIYEILDWNQVFITSGIGYGIILIIAPLMHLLAYGLVQLRIKIGTWFMIKQSIQKWKQRKVAPVEREEDPDITVGSKRETNKMRTLSADIGTNMDEILDREENPMSMPGKSSREQNEDGTGSVKSETSL